MSSSSFYRRGDGCAEGISDLPKMTWVIVSGGAVILVQAVRLQSLCPCILPTPCCPYHSPISDL